MNTLNGNFIERVIPNIKNATLNLLIGDQVATMNLADFQAAIAPSSKGLKMKDNLPLDGTLNNVVDSSDVVTISPLQLSTEAVGLSRTVNLSAGATTPRLFNVAYTINNSGAQTGTLTGLFLNATETALNGITHNLMDLQVGGVSKFLVNNIGGLSLGSGPSNTQLVINSTGSLAGIYSPSYSPGSTDLLTMRNYASGALQIQFNFTSSTNPIIKLGGTTSSFPAIKRNGAGIDFRLADDSGYCDVRAQKLTIGGNNDTLISSQGTGYFDIASNSNGIALNVSTVVAIGYNGIGSSASALLQVNSTTKGFLPPRMTTTQINAIATPAEGLVVYNTSISHLCVYQAGVWVRINHSPM